VIAGGWFITPHAVQRYRDRVPGARLLSYERALAALIKTMDQAHYVKTIRDGFELWRGPKPHRLRLRVSRGGSALPQVVTVLRGCDPGWQR